MVANRKLHLFMFCAEASGDNLGAALIRAFRQQHFEVTVTGIGGEQMQAAGLQPILTNTNLSHIGLVESLRNAVKVVWKMLLVRQAVRKFTGDALITIDVPVLSLGLAKLAQQRKIPVFQYVAPTVWAWHPERAKIFAKVFNCIYCLFSFEPELFTKHGGHAKFFGNPAITLLSRRRQHDNSLLLLPGSRPSEINQMLPIYLQAVKLFFAGNKSRVNKHTPRIVIAALPTTLPLIRQHLQHFPELAANISIVVSRQDKHLAMQQARFAVATLGTAALEIAALRVPMISAYRGSRLSYWLVRRKALIKYGHLVNIIANQQIIPELLMNDCNPERIAAAINSYWNNPRLAQQQLKLTKPVLATLAAPQPLPPAQAIARDLVMQLEQIKNNNSRLIAHH